MSASPTDKLLSPTDPEWSLAVLEMTQDVEFDHAAEAAKRITGSLSKDTLVHVLSLLVQQDIALRMVDEFGQRQTNHRAMEEVNAMLDRKARVTP